MLPNCTSCFEAELPECIDSFTVKGKLAINTPHEWTLIDKFDNKLRGSATTDGDGTIVIADASLKNLLRTYSGSFKIYFTLVGSEVIAQTTMCDTKQYDCITFSIFPHTGASITPIIGNCA